ncbi:MAG TPA: hypothetical protein VHX61_04650 [Rhizomicrobium sp.]|jgi:hypothetical protein|nr:hypothetical protein [Rhizomicrobium sp.]
MGAKIPFQRGIHAVHGVPDPVKVRAASELADFAAVENCPLHGRGYRAKPIGLRKKQLRPPLRPLPHRLSLAPETIAQAYIVTCAFAIPLAQKAFPFDSPISAPGAEIGRINHRIAAIPPSKTWEQGLPNSVSTVVWTTFSYEYLLHKETDI